MKLYGYWRSSASYRVRLALGLKNIAVDHVAVNLKEGEQHGAEYRRLNPQSLVPILELDDGTHISQSLAIMEYLEEAYPQNALLPSEPSLRAKIRAAALDISADIAPIQNLRILKFIRAEYGQDDEGARDWARHWISLGFKALERTAQTARTQYLFTDNPSLFECCLVPQIYNARRFGVDMSDFPRLAAMDKKLSTHRAFLDAHPDNQKDAVL